MMTDAALAVPREKWIRVLLFVRVLACKRENGEGKPFRVLGLWGGQVRG